MLALPIGLRFKGFKKMKESVQDYLYALAIAIAMFVTLSLSSCNNEYIEVYESYNIGECKYIRINGVKKPCSELKSASYDDHFWVE